jgi:hypothetical protein
MVLYTSLKAPGWRLLARRFAFLCAGISRPLCFNCCAPSGGTFLG